MIFLLCMMSAISLLFPVILPMFAVIKRTCRYCVLARFFIRSRLCCGSPSHTGTFGRERGRSLEGDFLAFDFILALSIIYVCHIQYYKHIKYQINAFVNITKLYIERSNLQLELIRYRIDFIDMFACEATVAMQYIPPNAYMRKFRTQTTSAPFLTVLAESRPPVNAWLVSQMSLGPTKLLGLNLIHLYCHVHANEPGAQCSNE